MSVRDPYALRLDWITGGSLSWGEYRSLRGGGLRSWWAWVTDAYADVDVREYDHRCMIQAGEAHLYRGIYYTEAS
jgi:hypothetical protein